MSSVDYTQELSVIEGKHKFRELDDLFSKPLDEKPNKKFYIALSITVSLMSLMLIGFGLTFY